MNRISRGLALTGLITTLLLGAVSFGFAPQKVLADRIGERTLRLASSVPGAVNTDHTFEAFLPSALTVGSIEFLYCTNSPIPDEPCTAPTGINVSTTTLALLDQSGETGFSVHPNTSNGTYPDNNAILITRPTSLVVPQLSSYIFRDLSNPTANGTMYVRITTFAEEDGPASLPSATIVDIGGVAGSINDVLTILAEVPPHLTFCVGIAIFSHDCTTASGTLVEMGTFQASSTAKGISKFLAYTNAQFGYSVSVSGTSMTSGNNVIAAMGTRTPSQAGSAQFGMNLRSNTNPTVGLEPAGPGTATPTANYNVANQYKFTNGDQIVSTALPNDRKTFTASYIVNIPNDQPLGIYTTTLTFIATATF